MTRAEKVLWEDLRKRQIIGHKFRRQYSIRGFVLDFYCPRLKLAIEVDGGVHGAKGRRIYDKDRQKLLECLGVKFMRFSNNDVFGSKDRIVRMISKVIKRLHNEGVLK
jgi:very-short-patch-repair endonuclease